MTLPVVDTQRKAIPASQVAIPKWQTLSIAGFSGMFAWLFCHPFEMWKNTVMSSPPGASMREAFSTTAEKGFYRGLPTGLARQMVYAPARLGCYPIFRDALLVGEVSLGWKTDPSPTRATMLDRALAGATAGAFASVLSSPIEVCLVLQTTSKEKMSPILAASNVFQQNGIKGFWSGIGALASRAALVGVSQVAVHDQVLVSLRGYNAALPSKFNDNLVVNTASVITSFIYSLITMPVEVARVRMSSEAKLGPGAKKRYHNVVQCIARVIREEGFLSMYSSFLPYFSRCAMHTVTCFFTIEYITRATKSRIAASKGLTLVPQ